MAYQFVNRKTGKTQVTDTSSATFSLAGINTQSNDANQLMNGLTTLLGIVGWEIQDVNRVVTQDVEETT